MFVEDFVIKFIDLVDLKLANILPIDFNNELFVILTEYSSIIRYAAPNDAIDMLSEHDFTP